VELWHPIKDFPGYSISSHGGVVNIETGYHLTLLRNQQGIVHVNMERRGIQYKRSVTRLVANAFLPTPSLEAFDTPINLDGDRSHNHIQNLMWRPRWFAIKYRQQFFNGIRGFDKPIEEVETGEQFPTSWEAATTYGLIDLHIKIAVFNRERVWPTAQLYQLL
jgi:hypothetical protein